MKLYEHEDFDQAILSAEVYFRSRGLRASIIEKDYYVTEVLRVIAQEAAGKVIFKGGTSLSKGWDLIHRFSEDIDLFLDPQAFEPTLGKNGIDRELKKLRDAVKAYPGLDFLPEESQTIGGSGRKDRFSYNQRFGGPGEVQNRVLLEAGTASGRQPTSDVQLRSLLAQFLEETERSLNAEDESSFTFRLLHFRRTFVEKMFALHSAVTRFQAGTPLGTQVRHYYDLYQLANTDEVQDMLKSKEYLEIRQDYDVISAQSFSRDYLPPENLSFANSIALFPSPELAAVIGQQYEQQCELLCYGETFPSWAAVLARLEELKSLL